MAGAAFLLSDVRGVLALGGEEARSFLQGMISNDVNRVAPGRAIYAALLTPQGRFLHDFFVAESPDGRLLLDCEARRLDDLRKRLTLYRLRAKVTIEDAGPLLAVALAWGPDALSALGLPAEAGAAAAFAEGVVFADPRTPAAGARAILPRERAARAFEAAGFAAGKAGDYERLRLSLGLPDGSRDLPAEKALLMESGFEELNGLDWAKGCYVGQELTARMKYRGLAKKRLVRVLVEGPMPAPGTPVTRRGKEVGEMRTGADGRALALLKIEALGKPWTLSAGDATVTPAET